MSNQPMPETDPRPIPPQGEPDTRKEDPRPFDRPTRNPVVPPPPPPKPEKK